MGWWDENMPKITVNNMTVSQVNKAVKKESLCIKLSKLLAAIVTGVVAFVCFYYMLEMWTRTRDIQDNCPALLADSGYTNTTLITELCGNSTLYDYGFWKGPYNDTIAAAHYKHLLL